MSVTPNCPGVYIEEVPGGVRSIVGVPTSITAFIGRARKGPLDEPITISDYGEFERSFGGLWEESMMSYAVRDFYRNGGSRAIVVRIYKAKTAGNNAAEIDVPTVSGGIMTLQAATVGQWGNRIQVSIDYAEDDSQQPLPAPLFNLRVYEKDDEGNVVERESHFNLTNDPNAADFVSQVLEQQSLLIRVKTAAPDRPRSTNTPTSPPTGPPVFELTTINVTREGSDGETPTANEYQGSRPGENGIFALDKTDLFNLLCIPPPTRDGNTANDVYNAALDYCVERRAMLIVDPPVEWGAVPETGATRARQGLDSLGIRGERARNAALYFPRVKEADPRRDDRIETFVPCGIIAGIMSRTDMERGVWKAPAGTGASLNGILGFQVNLTDDEQDLLNPLAINCLRSFPVHGRVVWGSRTMRGDDQSADEYKYVPVRRLALFIEESLYRGTQWAVFEPNNGPLWAQLRLNIGAFMHSLFRQGAFQGSTPSEAYFVKCDGETTAQTHIDIGVVNILVGFAPLKPAEFIIIKVQQIAGQIQT